MKRIMLENLNNEDMGFIKKALMAYKNKVFMSKRNFNKVVIVVDQDNTTLKKKNNKYAALLSVAGLLQKWGYDYKLI